MSYLIQPEYVRYECTCGSLRPISLLYFCRHCVKLRCGFCVCHEVDSHYCSNCMEHLPPTEAKLKKNRCGSCFDCPNCSHTLSVRATTRNLEESSKPPSKHYYLACFFCRWTTRDVGIPDQPSATGNWPVKENPHAAVLSSFLDYYKFIALKEKSQKDKKPFAIPRRGYSSYSEKYGITSTAAKKRAGIQHLPLAGKEIVSAPTINPSQALEDVEPLPESFFTEVPDLTRITSIQQRHSNPALQPETISELHPQHRHFYVKRSLRCRQCEHSVSKPEYNPGSIKFKISQTAYYHMPEVRIMTFEPFKAGDTSSIILKITNPMQHLTSIQFNPLLTREEELLEEERKKVIKEAINESLDDSKKMEDFKSLPTVPRKMKPNTAVYLPTTAVVLPPRDDAAEYDDTMDTHSFQDDPKVVIWRKGNNASVKFLLTPNEDLNPGEKVTFGFILEYGHVNTIPAIDQRVPQRTEVQVKIFISPGEVDK